MQQEPFGELEGIRMAAEMEKRGKDFYELAARISKPGETRDLLVSLSADETVHMGEFRKLYEREARKQETVLYSPETCALLTALAADIAFPEGVVGLAKRVESPRAILEYAIRSEEDSIRFYGEMIENAVSERTAEVFGDIISQEKRHLRRLKVMLSDLT